MSSSCFQALCTFDFAEQITVCGLDLCFLFFLKGLHTVTSFRISLQGLACPHDVIAKHSGAAGLVGAIFKRSLFPCLTLRQLQDLKL